MGKMFEALKKAEKERTTLLKKAGRDPEAYEGTDGEIDPHLVPYFDRMSPISEQYRQLRASLKGVEGGGAPKVIAVTSAVNGEGKSVTALNLAITFADDKDARVVVVDADMRNPSVHRLFGVDNQRGLSDYLAGNVMVELILQRSRLKNLSILPAGRLPGDPAELLGGKKLDDLVIRMSRDFDVVIVDTPAIVSSTDAAVVAQKSDGTLYVVRVGQTPREVVSKGMDRLAKARVKVLGTVATHVGGQDYYYSAMN